MAGRVILGWSYSVEVDSRDRRINVLGSTQDVVMVSKRKNWLVDGNERPFPHFWKDKVLVWHAAGTGVYSGIGGLQVKSWTRYHRLYPEPPTKWRFCSFRFRLRFANTNICKPFSPWRSQKWPNGKMSANIAYKCCTDCERPRCGPSRKRSSGHVGCFMQNNAGFI